MCCGQRLGLLAQLQAFIQVAEDMRSEFAVFEVAEHQERLRRARDVLREQGFGLCVSVAPETHFYLAGYDAWVGVNSPQALIFSVDDDAPPTLLVRNVDTRLAWETSWLTDIRSYQLFAEPFGELVAGICDEKAAGATDVAIELQSYALNASLYDNLTSALEPRRLRDATGVLGGLRIIKSDAEMELIREAARYAEVGLATARSALTPGMTEISLAAVVEHSMRAAGADYWAIPTELASGRRSPGGHATPRDKVIESGDLVHLEFAGVSNRYHTTAVHTLACGRPSARAQQLYEVCRASLAAGVDQCRVGALVSEVEEASLEPVRAAGLEAFANMRFGYGIGIASPPVWLETLQISRGFDTRLEPGMVFVLHAYLQLDAEHIGVIQGGTWALTQSGLEQLVGGGDVPLEIV